MVIFKPNHSSVVLKAHITFFSDYRDQWAFFCLLIGGLQNVTLAWAAFAANKFMVVT